MNFAFYKKSTFNKDETITNLKKVVKETGQMGVPVTTIVYDDSETEHVVGFDKNRLASILNIK